MSRRKLLLADDSITIQKVVNLTFADEGIEVIAVGDGNSALDRIQETPPDLVMADVNMPGLSGYELCERIKQDERLRHIPVILLVGSFEPFDEREAARVGAEDFLTKPFQSIRQLVNKVTGMLEATENRRAAGDTSTATIFADPMSETGATGNYASESTEFVAENAAADDSVAPYEENAPAEQTNAYSYVESAEYRSDSFDAYDAGKTQPLSARDLKDFSFVEEAAREFQTSNAAVETTTGETSADAAPEAPEAIDSASVSTFAGGTQKAAPPVFDFDDLNILEIPFDEEDEEEAPAADYSAETSGAEETQTAAQYDVTAVSPETSFDAAEIGEDYSAQSFEQEAPVSDTAAQSQFVEEIKEAEEGKTVAETEETTEITTETFTSETETADAGNAEPVSAEAPSAPLASADFSFPPELIEAIAQRVAEKLSAQTAGEIAPRVADLIVQKMAEEKLKQ